VSIVGTSRTQLYFYTLLNKNCSPSCEIRTLAIAAWCTLSNALHELNEALDNVHQAAIANVRISQLPRLRNQPDFVVKYEHGDLVLRDPRSNTGAIGLRTNKFEPLRLGPYVVDEQQMDGGERTNTVVCREVNDLGRYHKFHRDSNRRKKAARGSSYSSSCPYLARCRC